MNEEIAFLEAIARNPAEKTARLVFADWLQERDDPRAPWVRDDELWEWMKPRAKDPTNDLIAATARAGEGHKTVAALARLGLDVLPKVLNQIRKRPPGVMNLFAVLKLLGPSAEPALPLLLGAINDRDLNVQFGALGCLMCLVPSNAKAMDVAVAIASAPHSDPRIRALALETLASHEKQASAGTGSSPVQDLVKNLHELVRSGTGQQATEALQSLTTLGGLDASLIPDLVRRVAGATEHAPERQTAIHAFAQLGARGAEALMEAAAYFGRSDYRHADAAVGKLGLAAVPALRAALTSPNDNVRLLATLLLVRQRNRAPEPDAELVPALIALFRTTESWCHSEALVELERLGPAGYAAAPVLLECLERGDTFVHHRPGRFLEMGMSADAVFPALFRAIRTVRPEVAYAYARYLAEQGHTRAVLLHAVCRTGSGALAEVRTILMTVPRAGWDQVDGAFQKERTAGAGLGNCGEPARLALELPPTEAVDAITPFVSDKSKLTRLIAVQALWYTNAPDALPGLLLALKDKDKAIRITALRALEHLGKGSETVATTVRAALTDRAQDVRDVALEVLLAVQPRL